MEYILADHPELTSGKFLEATEFAKDIVDKAKDAVKAKHSLKANSIYGKETIHTALKRSFAKCEDYITKEEAS